MCYVPEQRLPTSLVTVFGIIWIGVLLRWWSAASGTEGDQGHCANWEMEDILRYLETYTYLIYNDISIHTHVYIYIYIHNDVIYIYIYCIISWYVSQKQSCMSSTKKDYLSGRSHRNLTNRDVSYHGSITLRRETWRCGYRWNLWFYKWNGQWQPPKHTKTIYAAGSHFLTYVDLHIHRNTCTLTCVCASKFGFALLMA